MSTFRQPKNHFKIAVLAATCSIITMQQAAAAFVEDSKKSVDLRNFYIERDFEGSQPSIGSWSQAVSGRFESGYTDSPVQVGLDLSAQYAVRLNDHNAERGDSIFLYDSVAGKQERDQLKLGATLKLKYNKTELKVGELLPMTPVAFIDNSRQLVTTYAGVMLESKEVKNLKISAGRITHINARNDDSFEKMGLFTGTTRAKFESDGLNYAGLDYNFSPSVSGAYWFGQLEDVYQQHYGNLAYSTKVGDTKIKVDARYFNYSEEGDALYGEIDAQSYGLMTTIEDGNHLLMTGVRKNDGPSMIPTLSGYAPQPYLHSWSNLGFVKPNELTWHVLYSYDFKGWGVNGLKATARYLNGSEIARPGLKDNSETEKSLAVKYVVPEGKLKGLGLELMHIKTDIKYDAAYGKGTAFDENRAILTYSYKF